MNAGNGSCEVDAASGEAGAGTVCHSPALDETCGLKLPLMGAVGHVAVWMEAKAGAFPGQSYQVFV